MLNSITITSEQLINQLKVSGKVPEVIEKIIARKIISEKATELEINPADQDLQKMADDLRLSKKLVSADETFKWLKKYGLSLDDFEEIAYTAWLSKEIATVLFSDKVEPYFFENQLDYMGIIMYEVVLDDQDLAMELFYSIKENEISFHDVAHQYIKDTELRRCGGYRGILSRKDLKPEISANVFAAKPPELLKPIVTALGCHLIYVEELIQPQLEQELRQQIHLDLFDEWIQQEANNWKITIDL